MIEKTLLSFQAVALECLRQMVNLSSADEFSRSEMMNSKTMIVGFDYLLHLAEQDSIYDVCGKIANELMANIRDTDRKIVVELPLITDPGICPRCELVMDSKTNLSVRLTVMQHFDVNFDKPPYLLRFEVGLNA